MAAHRRAIVLAILVLASATRSRAFVLGGGTADKDCRMAFGSVDATNGESGVVCTDGDPSCDTDGTVDGTCRFSVSLCTGVPIPGCAPIDLAAIASAGLPLSSPPVPSTSDTCGPVSDVAVAVGSAAGATAIARSGGELRDVDYLNLCCRTAAAPFDAARCALAVDPSIAGCAGALPAAAIRKWEHARAAVLRAADHPNQAKGDVRKAKRALTRLRGIGRRLAQTDDCGNALALAASHALTMIETAGAH